MRIPVSLLFLTFILAEIAGFILVGEAIGVLATLGLVLFGMLAGSILLRPPGSRRPLLQGAGRSRRRQGARPDRWRKVPCLTLRGAAHHAYPGFLSDLIGIALFIPAVRAALWRAITAAVRRTYAASATTLRRQRSRESSISTRSEYGTASPTSGATVPGGARKAPGRRLFRAAHARRTPRTEQASHNGRYSNNGGQTAPGAAPGTSSSREFMSSVSISRTSRSRTRALRARFARATKRPTLDVNVNVNARPQSQTDFEIELKLDARAVRGDETLFIVEVTYAGPVPDPQRAAGARAAPGADRVPAAALSRSRARSSPTPPARAASRR